jgi:hypothetical protein
MNKISSYIRKHLAIALLFIAVAALGASNYQLQNKINNGSSKVLSFESGATEEDGTKSDEFQATQQSIATPESFTYNLRHPNCEFRLKALPVSSTYISNLDYDLAFIKSANNTFQSYFQDMNGDNLPDYIYSSSVSNGEPGASFMENSFYGCIYLNDGNGFTKGYECYGKTTYNPITGAVLTGEYRGDCAGSPSAEGSKE